VQNKTSVLVLQHPRERLHALGTARFARLGLTNAHVEIAYDAGVRDGARPPWIPDGAALLYPAPGARDLSELRPEERPKHLVVIDGTWHTARTLYRDKTWLHELPHVRLNPAAPSRYRIRKEPSTDYVSTLEAIVEALRLIEPETEGFDALIAAFDRMIDVQVEYIRRGESRPRGTERRPKAWRKLPRALVEDFERLVVTYAESSRSDPRGPRELVQWTAIELSTGATFERLIRPTFGLPSPLHLAHMELSQADFADALPLETFCRDWEGFIGNTNSAIIAAWNQSSLDLLARATGAPASRASLKSAHRNVYGGGSGSLEDALTEAGVDPAPHTFRGRAAKRNARAVAMARCLHALSQGEAPRPVSELTV
jgi:DTW domain-containing protein YfiP